MACLTRESKLHNQKVKVKVFLVDDHPIVRQGITQLINQERDLMVCGDAEVACTALEAIKSKKPDIMVIDISLKGMNGIDLIKNIRTRHPAMPILVLSMHDESLYAERVLRAGAGGYIMKQEATGNVLAAIRRVSRGEIYVSDRLAARMLKKCVTGKSGEGTSPINLLSDRELEVFQLIGQGKGTRQIAKELFLSVKTVESYREHIKEKLKFENAVELVRHAIQWVEGEGLAQHG